MCDRNRERIDAQWRAAITAERIKTLEALLNEGRNGSDTLAATLQDLKNGNRPLSTRLGRGFTA